HAAAAGRLDRSQRLPGCRRIDVVDDDGGALAGEAEGDGLADAGAAAGHHGGLALQAHGQMSFFQRVNHFLPSRPSPTDGFSTRKKKTLDSPMHAASVSTSKRMCNGSDSSHTPLRKRRIR